MAQVTVGNCTYEFLPLPAFRAVDVLTRLMQILGPSVGEIMGETQKGKSFDLGNLNNDVLARAAKVLSLSLKEGDIKYLAEKLLGSYCYYVNGDSRLDMTIALCDMHFQKKPGALLRLIFEAIKDQFGDFLSDLGVGTRPAPQAAAPQ